MGCYILLPLKKKKIVLKIVHSQCWESLHKALGTNLNFSTTFHPQTDGQSKRTIHILEDILRACVLDFKDSWAKYLSLVEFAYNNSYQKASTLTHIRRSCLINHKFNLTRVHKNPCPRYHMT